MLDISGTVPGLLDKQQPQRLLRRPSSTLSFASFDPRTALGDHGWDIRGLTLNEELYRPKRVVIETTCAGESTWRFVPKARLDDGVVDEGQWPRVVEICGQQVQCSQDQFSIYCLDPAYDSHVRAPPELTVITKVDPIPKVLKQPLGKHRMSSAEPCTEMPPPKKSVQIDEEDEVAEMVVDDDAAHDAIRARSSGPGERSKKFREELEKNRKERREKGARRTEKLASQDEILFDFSNPHSPVIPDSPDGLSKRKVSSLFDSLRAKDDLDYFAEEEISRNTVNYSPTNAAKRSRTFSPGAAKRDLEARRLAREKQKRERRERKLNQRKQQRFQSFLNEIYVQTPNGTDPTREKELPHDDNVSDSDSDEEAEIVDEESERMAFIAESRRKLAELEADRPLWEQAAKRREQREREEQEAQQAASAQRRAADARRADEERKAKAERERQQTQEKENARARDAEARARRQREKQQRNERWAYGPWTTQRALERYKTLSDLFDSTKFSQDEPLTFDVVPWPVLHSPVSFTVEDIDWAAVEGFFNAIKPHMRSQDFVSFVEKSHRRFHPDRWRSRGLLKNIADEAERGCMEVAANTVAQALTPLWRDITGR